MPSFMPSRKRRRSQAFPREQIQEEDIGEDDVADVIEETRPAVDESNAEDAEDEKLTKEMEIWEAFKEEYHEVLDQLPLQLHRHFALIRELDMEVTSTHQYVGCTHSAKFLPLWMQYISARRAIAGIAEPELQPEFTETPAEGSADAAVNDGVVPMEGVQDNIASTEAEASTSQKVISPRLRNGTRNPSPLKNVLPVPQSPVSALSAPRTPTPSTALSQQSKATQLPRELLIQVVRLSEEVLNASQEKVNVAQAAYDSVDRHIRMLDWAIKEQEDSLSLGLRPGTHAALLPDLVVPRWTRNSRIASSPLPGFDELEDGMDVDIDGGGVEEVEEGGPALGMASADGSTEKGRVAMKKGRKGKGRKKEKDALDGRTAETPAPQQRLKLKVPPLAAVVSGDLPVDPNEPRYCYCNQVSYGQMVGCDNDECEREWFHLSCAGLTEAPKSTKWYCRTCKEKMAQSQPAGGRRKGR